MPPSQVQIAHGRLNTAVPEQTLNGVEIDTRLKQMRRKCMPQQMKTAAMGETGLFFGPLKDEVSGFAVHRLLAACVWKEPWLRAVNFPIGAKVL